MNSSTPTNPSEEDVMTESPAQVTYLVRPTRADQVHPGDRVRWTGLTRTIASADPIDDESIAIRFRGAGYDIPLYIGHHIDVIV